MISHRTLCIACALGAILSAGAAGAQPGAVAYSATLAGLPIGSGTLTVDEADGTVHYRIEGKVGGMLGGSFSATASAVRSGAARATLRTLWAGLFDKGESNASLAGPASSPRYEALATSGRGRWDHVVRFDRGNAAVERTVVTEEPDARRSPVTEGHRRDVLSPLHLIAQVMAADSLQDVDRLCVGRAPVFTGLTRFDIQGLGRVPSRTIEGAQRCRLRYIPVAGQRIDAGARPAEAREFEVDIVTRDRRFLPVRIAFPSRLGAVVITATAFPDGTATRASAD
ncbi:DUF3108 domain-containing protein [Alsobacter sp. R-9]